MKTGGKREAGSGKRTDNEGSRASRFPIPASRAVWAKLSRDQLLDLYYWMRLTRTLEERLVALYRQTKVVGGLFRSLGQEADAVGSCYALERRGIMSPPIRNPRSMVVKGGTPVGVVEEDMGPAGPPPRGPGLHIPLPD